MIAKTPETLTVEARRRISCDPIQAPLSPAARLVLAAIAVVTVYTQPERTPGRQRYVSFVDVRAEIGAALAPWAFERAVRELTGVYAAWARQPWRSTSLAEDNASVLIHGTSCHEVTADGWRD